MKAGISRIRQKLKGNRGFTIQELLIAILIMGLAGGLLARTVDLASKQFEKHRLESDAQLLTSSLSIAIQDELLYAYDIEGTGSDDEPVSFFSGSNRMAGRCCIVDGSYTGSTAGAKPIGVPGVLYFYSLANAYTYQIVDTAEYNNDLKRGVQTQDENGNALNVSAINGAPLVKWDSKKFDVSFQVSDSRGNVLSVAEFSVIPVMPDQNSAI